jgi:hypothetical protein
MTARQMQRCERHAAQCVIDRGEERAETWHTRPRWPPRFPGATISQLHHWRNLITRDRAQFSDPRECDAIKKSGLHHVRYAQRPGSRGLALALGAIIAAMPMVMEELETATAQACR